MAATASFVTSLPARRAPGCRAYLSSRSSRQRLSVIARPLRRPRVIQANANMTKDVDPKVLTALDSLPARVTVADVAASSGMTLPDAEKNLLQLASIVNGVVQVSNDGDLAYKFPSDVRGVLRSKSLRAAVRERLEATKPALLGALRISFGAFLFASIFITFAAIAIVSSSSDRDSDSRSSSSRGFGGGGFGYGYWIGDAFNIMFRQSLYDQQRREVLGDGDPSTNKMSFLEAVYSFVFGEGNPNANIEERRFQAIAAAIRANRGAVTAEQLAPYLDPPAAYLESLKSAADGDYSTAVVDESFVLPAVTQFGGHPEVTADGQIVYIFPNLQTSAESPSFVRQSPTLMEEEYQLTTASTGQIIGTVMLGIVNLFGVSTLSEILSRRGGSPSELLGILGLIFPALVLYAGTFWAAPVFRFLYNWRANAGIRQRNSARSAAYGWLQSGAVWQKIRAAESYVPGSRVVSEKDLLYSSDTGTDVDQERKWKELDESAPQTSSEKSDKADPSAPPLEDYRLKYGKKDIDKLWDQLS